MSYIMVMKKKKTLFYYSVSISVFVFDLVDVVGEVGVSDSFDVPKPHCPELMQ